MPKEDSLEEDGKSLPGVEAVLAVDPCSHALRSLSRWQPSLLELAFPMEEGQGDVLLPGSSGLTGKSSIKIWGASPIQKKEQGWRTV